MKRLIDIFYIRIKDEFTDADWSKLDELIPNEYKCMFSILWNEFQGLEEILSNENIEKVLNTITINRHKIVEKVEFFSRYRGEDCLQQILRKTFFNTVVILQNQEDGVGINRTYVLSPDDTLYLDIDNAENSRDDIPEIKTSAYDLINEDMLKQIPKEQIYRQRPVIFSADGEVRQDETPSVVV